MSWRGLAPTAPERTPPTPEDRAGLTNDPAMGVIRHVDAGYDRAAEVAAERGVVVPMERGDGKTGSAEGLAGALLPVLPVVRVRLDERTCL